MSRESCGVRNCNGLRDWFSRSFVFQVPRVEYNSGGGLPFRRYIRLAHMACENFALGHIRCSPSAELVFRFFWAPPVRDRRTPRGIANLGTVCNSA